MKSVLKMIENVDLACNKINNKKGNVNLFSFCVDLHVFTFASEKVSLPHKCKTPHFKGKFKELLMSPLT